MSTPTQRVVLVHGNPETADIWTPLVALLPHWNATLLSPPGFGAPVPDGFSCTMLEYRDWLIAQLDSIGEPVHLVGHDWGGLHVVNTVAARPDLVSSWASDTVGMFAPHYRWHASAAQWQAADTGLRYAQEVFGSGLDVFAEFLSAKGMPEPWATVVAAGHHRDLAPAVVALYRSARQPALRQAGANLGPLPARGLVIDCGRDINTGSGVMRTEMAHRCGAEVVQFPDLGHWWMLEDPERAAYTLESLWQQGE